MPPTVKPRFSAPIRVEDIDRALIGWFADRVDPHVVDQNGRDRKVPIVFASGERWVASADKRGIRDRDGRLILPVMSLARTTIDPMNQMSALGANVPTLVSARLVSGKTSALASNDSSRPISSRRLRQSAVFDVHTIPFPFTCVIHYELTVRAQLINQLNLIIEKIVSCLEFFDVPSFVATLFERQAPEANKTGVGSTETITEDRALFDSRSLLDRPYVVGYLDGELSSDGNIDEFTDDERIIETKIKFKVPANLQLDPEGKQPSAKIERTAFSIELSDETVRFVDDLSELDDIFGLK